MIYIFYLSLLFILELAYFKIADRYNIIDKPNHRSSHSVFTIRGGGVIFPISTLLWFFLNGFPYPLFIAGLLIISIVSFIDDIREFPKRWRLSAHLISIILIMLQLHLFTYSWPLIAVVFISFIGIINAYNFMDGINGITGIYSLVIVSTLLWINQYQTHFIDSFLLILIILGLAVFNFFNFRANAKCFAGDVGSIAMAFIISFLLLKLIVQTADMKYILLLAVYGVDTIFTIMLRLAKGENIFLAHRSHLYQLLVNECKQKHLTIASLYGVVQISVNFALLNLYAFNKYIVPAALIAILSVIYLISRHKINNQLSKTP
jgi:UDP-GlcNAc:undecaprenyl-phosphate GlcNAc-1-phosphate transferase